MSDAVDIAQWARDNQFKIRTDPVWFGESICNIEFDVWQIEALEAMADVIRLEYNRTRGMDLPVKFNPEGKTKFTIRAMHGPGKTFFAAFCIIWFQTAFRSISPATAPTLKQLKNRLWPNLRKIRSGANPFLRQFFEVKITEAIWHKDPNWKVVAETGAQPETLAGYHDDFMLIVVDEATGVKEAMFPVIESAMSMGTIILLLMIGNPTKTIGTFADSHLKPKVSRHYYKIHVSLDKTTRVDRKWVAQMIEKYGKDSPVVKIRCYGDFADDDENQLISVSWLETARFSNKEPDGSLPKQRLTIDVADGGGNFSVITHSIKYDSFVIVNKQKQYSFPGGKSTGMIVNEAVRLFNKFGMDNLNGDDIVVDSLGVGAGVCSDLVDLGYSVIRYMGGAASDNSKLYRCRRVQSYLVARDYFREEKIVFADNCVADDEWDDLYAQLCAVRRKIGTERFEDLATKEEMRIEGIESLDRADSIAMIFATQSPMQSDFRPEGIILGISSRTAGYDGQLS